MSEMIERVARAFYDAWVMKRDVSLPLWHDLRDVEPGALGRNVWRLAARSAIEAMRVSMSEREERLEEALQRIAQWADAYPLEVFPEPNANYHRQAHEVLQANGMSLDSLSANAMRYVIEGVGRIAKEALQ